MHFGTCCTLQARGFGQTQGEECGVLLRKMLEVLLYFREVAGGPRMRESCKSRGWDDDALAPHRRYRFKLHPYRSESIVVFWRVAMGARARGCFQCLLDNQGQVETATSCR